MVYPAGSDLAARWRACPQARQSAPTAGVTTPDARWTLCQRTRRPATVLPQVWLLFDFALPSVTCDDVTVMLKYFLQRTGTRLSASIQALQLKLYSASVVEKWVLTTLQRGKMRLCTEGRGCVKEEGNPLSNCLVEAVSISWLL